MKLTLRSSNPRLQRYLVQPPCPTLAGRPSTAHLYRGCEEEGGQEGGRDAKRSFRKCFTVYSARLTHVAIFWHLQPSALASLARLSLTLLRSPICRFDGGGRLPAGGSPRSAIMTFGRTERARRLPGFLWRRLRGPCSPR